MAFRKLYDEVGAVRAFLPDASVIAMTATAPKDILTHIVKSLHMPQYKLIRVSPDRKNIR